MSSSFPRIFCLAASLLATSALLATDPVWINNGVLTNTPVVDATIVVNNGVMSVASIEPFETSSTLYYTNTGIMDGTVGFRFSHNPTGLGFEKPATYFENRFSGSVASHSLGFTITPNSVEAPNYLYVYATNIINKGLLSIDAGGEMAVSGDVVDLSRGGTGVNPEFGNGSYNNAPSTNLFQPDIAIEDIYWGSSTQTFNSAGLLFEIGNALVASSPPHNVQTPGGFGGQTRVTLINPVWAAYTNASGFGFLTVTNEDGTTEDIIVVSNLTRQAVFVAPEPGYSADLRFYPSSIATNPMRNVALELSTPRTNLVTGNVDSYTLYFVDTLGGETNRGLYTNYFRTITDPGVPTYRPQSYLLSRIPVQEFLLGGPGNATVTTDFFYSTNFTNVNVTANYAGYGAQVESLISRPPPVQGGSITNLSGRVVVQGKKSLNLDRARMQAAGLINIQTPHLVSSTNAVIDAENLWLHVGSTNGQLNVRNLMKEYVYRMNGQVYAWSGLWSNSYNELIENWTVETNDMGMVTNAIESPLTNVVSVNFHTLMLDAEGLIRQVPVLVYGLSLLSTNGSIRVSTNDRAQVVEALKIEGTSFTLDGSITMSAEGRDWTGTNVPSLLYFTNNGILSVENVAYLGNDRATPYTAYVNRGLLQAFSHTVDSDYCEITGTNVTAGDLTFISRSAKFDGGLVNCGGDLTLSGDVFRFVDSLILVQGHLNFTLAATGSLADTGGGAGNQFICNQGFLLATKPSTGDLLGTAVRTVSPLFALVTHSWAGEDRGATAAGFENNVALGTLVLEPDSIFSDFEFQGVGASNGLYVDVLDLSLLPDFESRMAVAPNLTIYFAYSLGVPTEDLNGALGGRLVWVQDFAGPGSSVEVLLANGSTIMVNRALRESRQIDSDGDGLANGDDPYPFDPVLISQVALPAGQPANPQISWMAAPGVVYTVEYSSTGQSGDWHPMTTVTNTATSNTLMTVQDPEPVGGAGRFYRVYYTP